jgi:DNA-directed RNA polymerase specialized sigma24 family protein
LSVIESGTWDDATHARCDALVTRIVSRHPDAAAQARSWSELFALIAGDLERWCRANALLRRAGLGSEDDWRAVFLRVIERLVRKQYASLRAYQESCEAHRAQGTLGRTPFEAWLRQLVRYAAADEVERCLAQRRTRPAGGAATVEGLGQGHRAAPPSPVTAVAAKQRSARLQAALQQLDDDQRCALLRRVQGAGYDDIGGAMGVSAREAHDLVRAAKACLRRGLRQGRAAGER